MELVMNYWIRSPNVDDDCSLPSNFNWKGKQRQTVRGAHSSTFCAGLEEFRQICTSIGTPLASCMCSQLRTKIRLLFAPVTDRIKSSHGYKFCFLKFHPKHFQGLIWCPFKTNPKGFRFRMLRTKNSLASSSNDPKCHNAILAARAFPNNWHEN